MDLHQRHHQHHQPKQDADPLHVPMQPGSESGPARNTLDWMIRREGSAWEVGGEMGDGVDHSRAVGHRAQGQQAAEKAARPRIEGVRQAAERRAALEKRRRKIAENS
jgi:hypothetical protein